MTRIALLALVVTLSCPVPSHSAPANDPPLLASRVTHVATWKNGIAAITREVDMPSSAGEYAIAMPSIPLQGTIWVAIPTGARLAEIVSEGRASKGADGGLEDVACAAVGRIVTVERSAGLSAVSGRLVAAPCDRLAGLGDPSTRYSQMLQSTLRVQTNTGITTLGFGSVVGLHVEGDAPDPGSGPRRLLIRFDAVSGKSFEMTWLARGIAWAPAARLRLDTPTRGTLSTSATLVNEAEALEDVELDLVSGPAQFSMEAVDSPLADGGLRIYFESLAGRSPISLGVLQTAMNSGADMARMQGEQERSRRELPGDRGAGVEVAAEDASLRRIANVTLGRGKSSWRALWSEELSLEHVHRWLVPPVPPPNNYSSASPAESIPQHVVRIKNATRNPITSQPVELLSGDVIVGQSRIPYTPPGATVDVVIADALDLQADETEIELSRAERVSSPSGSYRSRVKLSGELVVTNRTGEAVSLEVVKELDGDLVSSSPAAEARKLGKGVRPDNPRMRLKWRVPVAAGEAVTLKYEYETWI